MKVIIIKNCSDGKINEIIDVSTGYATNFLIKKGLAVAYNHKTKKALEKRLNNIELKSKHDFESANKLKDIIEKLQLVFYLKVANNKIHGSITRKQIVKSLRENGINIDSKIIDNDKIESIGISKIQIHLQKNVIAELKIEVKEDEK